MIACLNPGEYQESVHTVSLASRTRQMYNFASSAQKRNTPKVDMEIKLRKWLESKGKTPSARRIGQFGTPVDRRTPKSVCSAKSTVLSNQGCSSLHERAACVARRNLFDLGGIVDTIMEDSNLSAERTLKEKSEQLESPLRKALSPINSNTNSGRLSSKDQQRIAALFPDEADNKNEESGASGNKFHSRGANLKSILVQEYVEFLNTATREELLELKGIGHKMAEYITELRDSSPLKSLKDLEKIGLSSKQVHNMFSKAARGIF